MATVSLRDERERDRQPTSRATWGISWDETTRGPPTAPESPSKPGPTGRGEIYVMNADGSGVKILTNDPAWDYAPVWSPDGTRIAFSRRYGDDWALYVMNADGSGATNLALGKAPFSSWSPDGRKIAFHCTSERICLVDLSEGRRR